MKQHHFCFLFSAIYLSPRVSDELAFGIAVVMTVYGAYAMWRGIEI